MARSSKPYVIETLPQLRALRSPARQEIIDGVQAAGPCTIADLGAQLGRAPDSLYYHIRSLLRLGLLVERPSGRARPASLLDVPGRPMRIRYKPEGAGGRALREAVASLLRLTSRDFAAGVASPLARVEGPGRNLWAARVKGRLSPKEAARVSGLLRRASEIMVNASRSPARGQLLVLTFCLTPAPAGRRTAGESRKAGGGRKRSKSKGGSR